MTRSENKLILNLFNTIFYINLLSPSAKFSLKEGWIYLSNVLQLNAHRNVIYVSILPDNCVFSWDDSVLVS